MVTFEKIKKVLLSHKQELRKRFNIKEIGIFGSYARNEQKKESDVDILIELRKPLGLLEFLDVQEFLEQLLKLKVDLVTKKALKPYIGKHILEEVVYL
ncbi:nucleotidyltransferase [bacterium]|nr:MAG: nucleotidyltransferase [bacterium]